MLNKSEAICLLKAHSIFSSLPESTLEALLSDSRCKHISAKAGDEILLENTGLSLIVSGSLQVYRRGNGLPVLLQRLQKGKVFGAATLFSDESGQLTELRAETESEIFFMPSCLVKELVESESSFALAYISFLSGKIRFLNKRISELSAPSTTQKLAQFLLREKNDIAKTKVELASALGIGRASLYRALDELSETGLISVNGKSVTVTDREGLTKLI